MAPTVEAYTHAGFVMAQSASPDGPLELPATAQAMCRMAYAGGADYALLAEGDDALIAYRVWHNMGSTSSWRTKVYLSGDDLQHKHPISFVECELSGLG